MLISIKWKKRIPKITITQWHNDVMYMSPATSNGYYQNELNSNSQRQLKEHKNTFLRW